MGFEKWIIVFFHNFASFGASMGQIQSSMNQNRPVDRIKLIGANKLKNTEDSELFLNLFFK